MRLRSFLSLLLLVSLLAACGGDDPEVEATETPVAEVTTTAPEPTETPTEKPRSSASTTKPTGMSGVYHLARLYRSRHCCAAGPLVTPTYHQ